MARTRVPAFLLAASIVFSACNGDEEPEARQTLPGPDEATVKQTFDCPNQADAVVGEPEGLLDGDVTGDGEPDEVSLVKDPQGSEGCVAFLVVASPSGQISVPIEQEAMTTELGLPSLRGLVELDGKGGLEIVVGLVAGASTEFFGAWSAEGERLERIAIKGAGGDVGDLFPSGGSVGHVEASDCSGEGEVVISQGAPQGGGYRVTRTFLEAEDGRFVKVRRERERIGSGAGFDKFPEFIASPFGSCSHA
jgi:hypothetical protein